MKTRRLLPLYMTRLAVYRWLTAWTCWGETPNNYWRRCVRFWTCKVLWLHRDWRSDGATIPKWKPDEQ